VKIVCVGGGPGGLYFASLAKLRNKDADVTVIERNPVGVTYGWGVSYSFLLTQLQLKDPVSAREIRASSMLWRDQEVFLQDSNAVHLGGYGFNIGRQRLLDILTARALDLGVRVEQQREVTDPSELGDADLIVACDGVRSRIRQQHADHFGTSVEGGRNKYIWLGTHRRFDGFAYAFEMTSAGWIWCYAYGFNADTSTFIVECCEQTWRALGFDQLGPDECTAMLQDIFGRHLDGHSLINQTSGKTTTPWLTFLEIRNQTWVHDNIALMGDAAHTTHFSIGSGTTLAMEDAIALADTMDEYDDLQVALKAYEDARLPAVNAMQAVARNSAQWFENSAGLVHQSPVEFGYSLLRRRHGIAVQKEAGPRWRYGVHLATQHPALRRQRYLAASLRSRLRPHRRD
jgi:anthraniloyl-CoA monooxygenase